MPAQETIYNIGIELLKLFTSGLLGGLVAHYLSVRLFKVQQKITTRREFQLKRIEALRDANLYLHWLYRDVFYNWEKPANKNQSPEEYLFELMNKVNYWQTLFLNDPDMSKSLQKLHSLIGESRKSFVGENKIHSTPLGETINELKMIIIKKINEIENAIT
jgi:hypothetical protein